MGNPQDALRRKTCPYYDTDVFFVEATENARYHCYVRPLGKEGSDIRGV